MRVETYQHAGIQKRTDLGFFSPAWELAGNHVTPKPRPCGAKKGRFTGRGITRFIMFDILRFICKRTKHQKDCIQRITSLYIYRISANQILGQKAPEVGMADVFCGTSGRRTWSLPRRRQERFSWVGDWPTDTERNLYMKLNLWVWCIYPLVI